ncbi:MAG: type II secretion system protein [Phycisphaeraceae bacterium]|nr:type II secretion system protein [Phycisphaeraceae bacterium]MCB9847131.1 type II secretion system protein [Phycisphaeraceae bacterium]
MQRTRFGQLDTTDNRARRRRGGFTLLESLIALVILTATVLAVGSAISASNQQSIEGQKQILAAMAADDLLAELCALPYAELDTHNGLDQAIGEMTTLDGLTPYPDTYWLVGRTVSVVETDMDTGGLGVKVRGMLVTVSAYDENRTLSTIQAFVPEPAS